MATAFVPSGAECECASGEGDGRKEAVDQQTPAGTGTEGRVGDVEAGSAEMDEEKGTDGEEGVGECSLRFLMVTGANFTLKVPSSMTIKEVKQKIIDERPQEMVDSLLKAPAPQTPFPAQTEEIRVLYFGKFLDDHKTLHECNFPTGPDALTTVHITVKAPPSVLGDVKGKLNKRRSCCCSVQ